MIIFCLGGQFGYYGCCPRRGYGNTRLRLSTGDYTVVAVKEGGKEEARERFEPCV